MTAPTKRVLLSWSSGKDSAWSLHVLRQDPTVEVVGLLTTVNQAVDRVAMHAVRASLLHQQAELAGLPVDAVPLPWPCSNEDYEAAMGAAVERALANGVTHMAFGDLFLEDIRAYREDKLAGTGLQPLFPLWGRDTAVLARSMVDAGLQATLTCVDPRQVPSRFVGRRFDHDLLDALPASVDPCGENGEFHTFVHAGPMLAGQLDVTTGQRVERGGFHYIDIDLT